MMAWILTLTNVIEAAAWTQNVALIGDGAHELINVYDFLNFHAGVTVNEGQTVTLIKRLPDSNNENCTYTYWRYGASEEEVTKMPNPERRHPCCPNAWIGEAVVPCNRYGRISLGATGPIDPPESPIELLLFHIILPGAIINEITDRLSSSPQIVVSKSRDGRLVRASVGDFLHRFVGLKKSKARTGAILSVSYSNGNLESPDCRSVLSYAYNAGIENRNYHAEASVLCRHILSIEYDGVPSTLDGSREDSRTERKGP